MQGGGGNTSVIADDGESMYIKASGTALKDMNSRKGWRRVSIEAVNAIFADKSLGKMDVSSRELKMVQRLQAACNDTLKNGARPSVESPLHVVLDKCVIHLHALVVLSYASAKAGKARIFELFQDEAFPPLWVPYADPGFSLGWKAFHLVRKYQKNYDRKPAIMFLEKHGLLVAADSPAKALRSVRRVIRRCRAGLPWQGNVPAARPKKQAAEGIRQTLLKALREAGGEKVNVSYIPDKMVSAIFTRPDANILVKAPPLTPDEMGFVSSPVMWLEHTEYEKVLHTIVSGLRKGQKLPTAFLVKEIGLFVVGNARMAEIVKDIVVGSLFVRSNAQDMGGINGLNRRQRDFIENWEAEKFRIQLATG